MHQIQPRDNCQKYFFRISAIDQVQLLQYQELDVKKGKYKFQEYLFQNQQEFFDFALLITSVQVQPRNNSEKLLISKISATDQVQMMLYLELEAR